MELLQTELDNNVDVAIQNAFSRFSAADMKGELEDLIDIENFEKTLLASLDMDIGRTIQANQKQRNFLFEQYKGIAQLKRERINKEIERKETYNKNRGVVNEKMSKAKRFYVDGNNNPIMGVDGLPIQYKPDALYTGMDPKTGNFVMVTM